MLGSTPNGNRVPRPRDKGEPKWAHVGVTNCPLYVAEERVAFLEVPSGKGYSDSHQGRLPPNHPHSNRTRP